jgi:hypothetical protein
MHEHIKKHILFGMNCNTIKLNKQRIKITDYCCKNTSCFLTFWKYWCLQIQSGTWNTYTELNAECWHYLGGNRETLRVFIIKERWCTQPPHWILYQNLPQHNILKCLIGCGGPWPPWSPNITLLDFFMHNISSWAEDTEN